MCDCSVEKEMTRAGLWGTLLPLCTFIICGMNNTFKIQSCTSSRLLVWILKIWIWQTCKNLSLSLSNTHTHKRGGWKIKNCCLLCSKFYGARIVQSAEYMSHRSWGQPNVHIYVLSKQDFSKFWQKTREQTEVMVKRQGRISTHHCIDRLCCFSASVQVEVVASRCAPSGCACRGAATRSSSPAPRLRLFRQPPRTTRYPPKHIIKRPFITRVFPDKNGLGC